MIPRRPLVLFLAAVFALGPVPGVAAAEPAKAAPPPAPPPTDTIITSDRFDMVSTDKETTFTYLDNVVVSATNLKLTCDKLVVIARRSGDPKATVGKQEKLRAPLATGRVRLVQDDREATCARAEVLPDDDKVILTGSPVIRGLKDGWSQTGEKMILHRGERRAEVVGEGSNRPQTTLPALKDLGYDKVPEKKKPAGDATKEPAPAEAPAAVSVPLPPSPSPVAPK